MLLIFTGLRSGRIASCLRREGSFVSRFVCLNQNERDNIITRQRWWYLSVFEGRSDLVGAVCSGRKSLLSFSLSQLICNQCLKPPHRYQPSEIPGGKAICWLYIHTHTVRSPYSRKNFYTSLFCKSNPMQKGQYFPGAISNKWPIEKYKCPSSLKIELLQFSYELFFTLRGENGKCQLSTNSCLSSVITVSLPGVSSLSVLTAVLVSS